MIKVPSAWPAVDRDMFRERDKAGQVVPATTMYVLGMFTALFFPKAWNLEMTTRVFSLHGWKDPLHPPMQIWHAARFHHHDMEVH